MNGANRASSAKETEQAKKTLLIRFKPEAARCYVPQVKRFS